MKKAKKNLVLAFFCIVFANISFAQFYGGIQVGYSFPSSESLVGYDYSFISTVSQSYSYVYRSFGNGINAQANIGYMFNENIGADLGVSYTGSPDQVISVSNSNGSNSNTKKNGTQIRLIPAILLMVKRGKLSPYLRVGLVLPVSTILNSNYNNDNNNQKSVSIGKFGFGYSSNLGVNFTLSDKMSLFSEFALTTLNIKMASSKITESTYNGNSNLGSVVYNTETKFVDEISNATNSGLEGTTIDNNKPREALSPTYSYSSIGVNVGMKFGF